MLVPPPVTWERAAGYDHPSERSWFLCLRCQFTLTNRGPHVPNRQNRSKRTGTSPNKVVPIHEGAEALRASLDDTDLAIVRALQANARATYTEIGRAVGLSAASVHERAHRLEARGVIRGYHAEVDPEVLGLEVLSLVSVLSSDSIDAAATEAGMAAIRQVETAYNVAGEDSYLLVVRTRSIAELSEVLQRLQAVDGVARTRTAVVLATPVQRGPVV